MKYAILLVTGFLLAGCFDTLLMGFGSFAVDVVAKQ